MFKKSREVRGSKAQSTGNNPERSSKQTSKIGSPLISPDKHKSAYVVARLLATQEVGIEIRRVRH